MKPKIYRRLPGRGRRSGFVTLAVSSGWCTLWQGPDHLLAVESQNYREEYKRFYYRDIQAITTRRTRRAAVFSILLGALLALLGSLIVVTESNVRVAIAIVFGSTLALLAINLLRGPSCICQLHTAVHAEQLPSLNRLKNARKAIASVRPLIEQAQGTLSPEQIQAAASAPPVIAAGPTAIPLRAGRRKIERQVRHENGVVHMALFSLLVFDAFWTLLHFFVQHIAIMLVGLMLMMAVGVLVVWALVRQADSDLPTTLRRLVLGTLAYLLLSGVVGYIHFIIVLINHPRHVIRDQWDMLRLLAESSPSDSLFATGAYVVSALVSLAMGMAGVLMLLQFRRQWEARATPPGAVPMTQG